MEPLELPQHFPCQRVHSSFGDHWPPSRSEQTAPKTACVLDTFDTRRSSTTPTVPLSSTRTARRSSTVSPTMHRRLRQQRTNPAQFESAGSGQFLFGRKAAEDYEGALMLVGRVPLLRVARFWRLHIQNNQVSSDARAASWTGPQATWRMVDFRLLSASPCGGKAKKWW